MEDVLALMLAVREELNGLTKSEFMYVSDEARGRLMCIQHLVETAHRHISAHNEDLKKLKRQ